MSPCLVEPHTVDSAYEGAATQPQGEHYPSMAFVSRGALSRRWSAWFICLEISQAAGGAAILRGPPGEEAGKPATFVTEKGLKV